MNKRGLAAFGIVVLFLAFLTLVVSCEIKAWRECRQTMSWYTCMRMLNK